MAPKRGASAAKRRPSPGRGKQPVGKGDGGDHGPSSARTGDTSSAEGRVRLSPGTEGRRPAAVSKYDAMTVYDPTTKTVTGKDGIAVAVGPVTLAQLSALPGPFAMLDRPYVCDPADVETILMLSRVAGTTVAALEARRRDHLTPPVDCPATTPENRRRCWKCPRWSETNETPF